MSPLETPGEDPEVLSPEDLVIRWREKVQVSTLKDWRRKGKGPAFFRLGAERSPVLYRIEAVREWEAGREVPVSSRVAD